MTPSREKIFGFILKGYPRLSETFIVNEILLLEELGYKLHIFALRNPGESKVHDHVRRVQAKVTYIPDYFWPFFFAFMNTNIRLFLNRPRVYWPAFWFALTRSVRQRSSSTIKRFVQAAYLVQKHLAETGVSHFHAHFSHGPTTVAYFAAWLTGLHYSFSAHAKDIYLQEHEFLREKIRRAKFAVTCTEYNRKHMLEIAGHDAPVYRVYHGNDLQLFKAAPSTRSNDRCPVILSVGRFVPKKGFPVLMQALQKIKQQGLSFRAFIVGGGPLQSELEKLQTDLGLSDCVVLLSQMSQTELLAYYRQADVFALACEVQNDGDRDGIPNVLVEAMAMGIPVVSTSISGIPELIENGVNGLLVAEKDPSALAEAIATLLRQPELAQRLGRAGRAKVERDFDARRNVEKIGELLRSTLDSRARTASAFHETKSKLTKPSRKIRRSAAVASIVDT
ncbi:MAG: glycosyltransferase [candidate division KSB1 bacterium]|nr:glycosyltransferase [candidate division KSB1 bacterium]MDZ7302404.1 glycosyltransferase [candidate division KSB1 bacterium]MDZ7311606.1 glycosyltransferase [candidate division KSB1 bacterium]